MKPSTNNFDVFYQSYGEKFNINWKILKAIAMIESSENPNAVGDNGNSIGLCQIQKVIAEYYNFSFPDDLYIPEYNIMCCAMFLQDLMSKYQDYDYAIQAYNLGETKFNKGLTSPTYLAKVKQYIEIV